MFSVYADGQLIFMPLDRTLTIHNPKVTLEIGKAGAFQFEMPSSNLFYNKLQQMRTVVTVVYEGVEIFRGRVLTNNRSFGNVRSVYCEGDLAYLVDSVQKGTKFNGKAHDLFRRIIDGHNARVDDYKKFTVGNITVENRDVILSGKSEEIEQYDTRKFNFKQIALNSIVDDWMNSFDYIEDVLISYCGGYLRTRREGDTTYIDYLADYDRVSPQMIEFGTNLLDISEEIDPDEMFTVLIPLGDENLTLAKLGAASMYGARIQFGGGSDEIVDTEAVARYGRIVKTHVFDNVNNRETLLENALRYFDEHSAMKTTYTAKAVDWHLINSDTDSIYIGDKVYVYTPTHNLTELLTCTKIEYDLANPGNSSYTFGNPKQTLTERYRKDKQKSKGGGGGRKTGGGSGAGDTADAVADAVDASMDDIIDYVDSGIETAKNDIYDAYIQVDKEHGNITLKALYERLENSKTVLKRTAGIDIDAPTGTVNIYSMNDRLRTTEDKMGSSEARIKTLADDFAAYVDSFAKFRSSYSDTMTSITQRVDADSASISSIAQWQSNTDSKLKNLATIESKVTAAESSIKLLAQYDANASNRMAQIELKANEQGTAINLKADKVYVDGQIQGTIARFTDLFAERLKTDVAFAAKLSAAWIEVGSTLKVGTTITCADLNATHNINASNTINAPKVYVDWQPVATQSWVNSTISNKFGGDVTFGGTVNLSKKLTSSNTIEAQNVFAKSMNISGKAVATQEWVNNKLKDYLKSSTYTGHTHKFTLAHTHKYTDNGTERNTGYPSTSSGTTGKPQ